MAREYGVPVSFLFCYRGLKETGCERGPLSSSPGIFESLLIMDFVKPVNAVLVTFLDKVN